MLKTGRLVLWRHPGLSHGAFDDVLLTSFALRAGERSQILAQPARLNRGQPHRRTAIDAWRTLALCVEHVALPDLSLSLVLEFAGEPTGRIHHQRLATRTARAFSGGLELSG